MEQKLVALAAEALAELGAVKTARELEHWRVKYLGRKGAIAEFAAKLPELAAVERRQVGQKLNELKKRFVASFDEAKQAFGRHRATHRLDLTQPGRRALRGHLHPLTKVRWEIEDIFSSMGFAVVEGPEVVSEYDNFDSLNMPPDHPAREMWDTIWLKSQTHADRTLTNVDSPRQSAQSPRKSALLLRAHTSAFQVRYMQAYTPPFRIIIPGRVYRYEATDATHETQFHQVEGLMVGNDVSAAHFVGVMQEFFRRFFRKHVSVRLRPGYFPFTEPSFEMDMSCFRCGGTGCRVCKETGWLELMGAGMVHPNVFAAAGYAPREWQGFAFGMGLERPTMMKYGIDDIRLFHSGDLRFLKQF